MLSFVPPRSPLSPPVLVLVLVAVLVPVSAAFADSPGAETPPSTSAAAPTPSPSLDFEVERQATRAQRLLDRGQTQEAIAAFRRAYELRADARFLYDIAECYRQLGNIEQALHFYRRYLSVAPDAADRDEVEDDIAALERRLPPRAAPPSPPKPSLAHDLVVVPVAEPGPPEVPPWRRWWAWAALGAALAGGAALAFALTRSETDVPATALGDKKFYQ